MHKMIAPGASQGRCYRSKAAEGLTYKCSLHHVVKHSTANLLFFSDIRKAHATTSENPKLICEGFRRQAPSLAIGPVEARNSAPIQAMPKRAICRRSNPL